MTLMRGIFHTTQPRRTILEFMPRPDSTKGRNPLHIFGGWMWDLNQLQSHPYQKREKKKKKKKKQRKKKKKKRKNQEKTKKKKRRTKKKNRSRLTTSPPWP